MIRPRLERHALAEHLQLVDEPADPARLVDAADVEVGPEVVEAGGGIGEQ